MTKRLTNYHQPKIVAARAILQPYDHGSGPQDRLLSIKIRAVDNPTDYVTRYVYPAEYEDIYKFMDTQGTVVKSVDHYIQGLKSNNARVYRLLNGDYCLFVEHETGPELIAFFDSIRHVFQSGTGAVVAVTGFVRAVNELVRILNNSIDEHAKNPTKRRHFEAGAIGVECRDADSERRITALPASPEASTPDAISNQQDIA